MLSRTLPLWAVVRIKQSGAQKGLIGTAPGIQQASLSRDADTSTEMEGMPMKGLLPHMLSSKEITLVNL